MPKIPEEIKLKWVDLFLKGNTITDISRIIGSSRKNIREELLIRGLRDKDKTPIQRKLTNKTPEKIMSLVNEEKTDEEIMVELGISRTMIWRYRQKIVLTWISEKDERLKYVLMGKSPKTIKAAFEFLNLWSEVCNQEVPVNLRSRGYINGKCAWAEFFGRRHGVTGASVLNVVEAVLKKLGMTLEDVIKDDWK